MSIGLPAPARIDIKALRDRFGLTQADIADELHVDERTVRRWERGASHPSPMAIAHMRAMQARMKGRPEHSESSANGSVMTGGAAPRRRLPTI